MLSVFLRTDEVRGKCEAQPAYKNCSRKGEVTMMRRSMIALLGVVIVLVAAGCGDTADKPQSDVTGTPIADITEAPASPTPEVNEEQPYTVTFTGKEEVEEVKDGDFVYFRSYLYYPVFEGQYADNMNRFVASATESFREALPEAEENAKLDYEDFVAGEFVVPIFPEEEEFSVSCLWNRERYMTLFTKCISNTGGAHPNVFCQAYVVNVTNGYQESLEQMLEPYGVTTDALVDYVTEKLLAEHGEDLFEYDDNGDFEADVYRFAQNNQWYFNDKGLVVFANPYEIAAYAYGMIECEISYEELEQGLKK